MVFKQPPNMALSWSVYYLIHAKSLDFVFDLSQVVQSGGKNIELAVIRRNQPLKVIYCNFDFFILYLLYV